MQNNHLTYFKIENFKKFDSLEINDIGQFNLVVGDNNIGKTCLLEAFLFDSRFKNTLNHYHNLLIKRNLISSLFMLHNESNVEYNFEKNEIAYYQKNIKKPITFFIDKDIFTIENRKEEIRITSVEKIKKFIEGVNLFDYSGINKKSSNWLVFRKNEEIKFLADITSNYYDGFLNRPEDSKIPALPALMLSDKIEDYIVPNYELIFKELNLEKRIFELIHTLFPAIEIIAFQKFDINSTPLIRHELNIKTKEREEYHNIREYGEGFVRCLYMIVLILTNKENSKLVIDEIDTGIHYTKLKDVLSMVLKLCKELDVQLFATTHSKECMEAFMEASKEIQNEKEVRLIELKEYKSKVYANTLKYESITTALESEIDLRGGNLYIND